MYPHHNSHHGYHDGPRIIIEEDGRRHHHPRRTEVIVGNGYPPSVTYPVGGPIYQPGVARETIIYNNTPMYKPGCVVTGPPPIISIPPPIYPAGYTEITYNNSYGASYIPNNVTVDLNYSAYPEECTYYESEEYY